MAKFNVVDKQIKMELDDLIRFQLITHCHIEKIPLSELDLECLSYLGQLGKSELTEFCDDLAAIRLEAKIQKRAEEYAGKEKPEPSPQTIRNVLLRAEKFNLIKKEGKGRKTIYLHPDIKIQTTGNILLNYKAFYVGTQEA
jgi:hypothetical protein